MKFLIIIVLFGFFKLLFIEMIRSAIKISLPIMFGFVPLGIAFGLLFQDLGYPWYFASLMGIIVYAGAAQFMAIGFLSSRFGDS